MPTKAQHREKPHKTGCYDTCNIPFEVVSQSPSQREVEYPLDGMSNIVRSRQGFDSCFRYRSRKSYQLPPRPPRHDCFRIVFERQRVPQSLLQPPNDLSRVFRNSGITYHIVKCLIYPNTTKGASIEFGWRAEGRRNAKADSPNQTRIEHHFEWSNERA